VSAAIGTEDSVPLKTRETVLCDTPTARAMSCIVTLRPRAPVANPLTPFLLAVACAGIPGRRS